MSARRLPPWPSLFFFLLIEKGLFSSSLSSCLSASRRTSLAGWLAPLWFVCIAQAAQRHFMGGGRPSLFYRRDAFAPFFLLRAYIFRRYSRPSVTYLRLN